MSFPFIRSPKQAWGPRPGHIRPLCTDGSVPDLESYDPTHLRFTDINAIPPTSSEDFFTAHRRQKWLHQSTTFVI